MALQRSFVIGLCKTCSRVLQKTDTRQSHVSASRVKHRLWRSNTDRSVTVSDYLYSSTNSICNMVDITLV